MAGISTGSDPLTRFEALLAPRGQELLGRLRQLGLTPDTALRVATSLRAGYPAELVSDALTQHELRLRARPKFSRAMDMFFTRPGLEQASAEPVARHRARRYVGAARVADLCCGIGGDLVELAVVSGAVLAVDRDPLHLRIALANAEVHGVAGHVTAVAADVREVDLAGVQAVFIDPARRTDRRRLPTGDSEPPLDWCLSVADRVGAVGVKAAPGLPREAIPPGWELEFVAMGRDLKEAVAWSPALATAARRATILRGGETLARPVSAHGPGPDGEALTHPLFADEIVPDGGRTARRPEAAAEVVQLTGASQAGADDDGAGRMRPPGEFLYDPNPAVTRAGLVRELARLIGAWQIDDQIAFLSADVAKPTPFARLLRVIDSAPWDQKRLPARLRALDIGAVDIRRRGLAGDVERLHRQLKLSGTRRATLVMTRVNDRPWALVCLDP